MDFSDIPILILIISTFSSIARLIPFIKLSNVTVPSESLVISIETIDASGATPNTPFSFLGFPAIIVLIAVPCSLSFSLLSSVTTDTVLVILFCNSSTSVSTPVSITAIFIFFPEYNCLS